MLVSAACGDVMNNKIGPILKLLIDIGTTESIQVLLDENKARLEKSGINRSGPDFWAASCAQLSKTDSLNLFKGLIIAEKEYRLSGGSTAGNIWVLRTISKTLEPAETFDLIDWALGHRGNNEYTPFGRFGVDRFYERFGREVLATCEQDYLEHLLSKYSILKEARSVEKKELDDRIKQEKIRERGHFLNNRNEESERRRTVLSREIELVSKMSQIERLNWIVETKIPIYAVPISLFAIDEIVSLYSGYPDLRLIVEQLGPHKGHWKKLTAALSAKK